MTPTITVSQGGGVTIAIEYQTNTTGFTGTAGSLDNAILRANGTGGSVIQGSLATIADDGTLDAPAITVDGDPVALKEATKSFFVPVSQMYGTSANPVSPALYNSPVGQKYLALSFDKLLTTTDQYAEFDLMLPTDANLAAAMNIRLVWRNTSYPTSNGTVGWKMRAQAFTFAESPDLVLPELSAPTSSSDNYVRYEDFSFTAAVAQPAFCRFQIIRHTPDTFSLPVYLIGAYITYSTL